MDTLKCSALKFLLEFFKNYCTGSKPCIFFFLFSSLIPGNKEKSTFWIKK